MHGYEASWNVMLAGWFGLAKMFEPFFCRVEDYRVFSTTRLTTGEKDYSDENPRAAGATGGTGGRRKRHEPISTKTNIARRPRAFTRLSGESEIFSACEP